MVESYGAQYVSLHVRVSNIAEQVMDNSSGEEDEGEEVGEVGKKEEDGGAEGEKEKEKVKVKKRKVKVGRGLGVGDLVERNESKA